MDLLIRTKPDMVKIIRKHNDMKNLLFTFLFLFTFHLSQAQVKLNHIAVYVENLAESKSFYSKYNWVGGN